MIHNEKSEWFFLTCNEEGDEGLIEVTIETAYGLILLY